MTQLRKLLANARHAGHHGGGAPPTGSFAGIQPLAVDRPTRVCDEGGPSNERGALMTANAVNGGICKVSPRQWLFVASTKPETQRQGTGGPKAALEQGT